MTLFLGIDGTVVSAQTLSISGQVIGGDSKERLPYANVKIKGTNIGTQTNLQGFFLMQNIPESVFVVQATFIGYLPAELTVDPKKQSTGILITLEQSTINLEGVTVSAEQSNFLKQKFEFRPKNLDLAKGI